MENDDSTRNEKNDDNFDGEEDEEENWKLRVYSSLK